MLCNGKLTLKEFAKQLIEDKNSNYQITLESKELNESAEVITDYTAISDNAEQIYVINKNYEYEVKVPKLFNASLTTPLTAGESSENNGRTASNSELLEKIDQLTERINNMETNTEDNAILKNAYPVGSIYMSINNTNPEELFGGTWEEWGSGRVPVGVNSNDVNFNTIEKTGGVSSVTLTAAQSGIPAHSHGLNNHTHSIPALSGTATGENYRHSYTGPAGMNGFPADNPGSAKDKWWGTYTAYTGYSGDLSLSVSTKASTTGKASGNTSNNTATDASQDHTNLQSYITCYMWKRTE